MKIFTYPRKAQQSRLGADVYVVDNQQICSRYVVFFGKIIFTLYAYLKDTATVIRNNSSSFSFLIKLGKYGFHYFILYKNMASNLG